MNEREKEIKRASIFGGIGGIGATGCIYLDVVLGVEGRVADRRHRVRGHPVQRYRVHLQDSGFD